MLRKQHVLLIISALALSGFIVYKYYSKSHYSAPVANRPLSEPKVNNSTQNSFTDWDYVVDKANGIPVEDSDTYESKLRKSLATLTIPKDNSYTPSADFVTKSQAVYTAVIRSLNSKNFGLLDERLKELKIESQSQLFNLPALLESQQKELITFIVKKTYGTPWITFYQSVDRPELPKNVSDAGKKLMISTTPPRNIEVAELHFPIIGQDGGQSHLKLHFFFIDGEKMLLYPGMETGPVMGISPSRKETTGSV